MSQFYQVVNGGGTATTVSLEELRHIYPNLQCLDNVQYHIINQEDAQTVTAYQQQQHGSSQQLIGITTNPSSYGQQQQASQGVYVLETVEQNTGQAAVVTAEALQQQQLQRVQHIQQRVQQIQQVEQVAQVQQVTQAQQATQHQQAQHVRTHFQIQQQQQTPQQQPQQRRIQQQAHLQQRQQQPQQTSSPQQSQQQQPQTYYNNVTLQHSQSSQDSSLTVLDSGQLTARQSMQVSVIENVVEQPHYQSRVKYLNRTAVPAQQTIQQQSPPQMLNQVLRTAANNAVTLQDGRKITLEEWQQLQLHQQQIAAAAAAAKRSDRNTGVITVTRQNAGAALQAVNSPGVPQQRNIRSPRPELVAQRRQCTSKSRVRTQNALVTNNTVQAIASPTVEKHQTLLQQENIIAVGDGVKHQQQLQQQQLQQQLHQQQQMQLQQQQQPPPLPPPPPPPPPPPQPPAQPQPQQQQPQQPQHTAVIPTAPPTQILILLPDGDQRIFNFDISQGHFSVGDLLEQVRMTCEGRLSLSSVENTTVERPVDQAVTPQVGTPTPTDVQQEKVDVKEPVLEIKQESITPVPDVNTNPQDQQNQLPPLPATQQQQPPPSPTPPPLLLPQLEQQQQLGVAKILENIVVKAEEPPDIKPTLKEEPKYVSGKLAVCHNCGYTSLDFNRCQRCKRKLPENCKSIPVCDSFKKRPVKEGGISPEKIFQKVNIKTELSGEVPKGRARPRPPSKRSRSKLVEEQPVILTLSSDDEDNTNSDFDSTVTGDKSLSSRLSNDGFNGTNAEISSVMNKEPIITEEEDTGSDSDRQREAVRGGGRELESMDGIKDGSFNGSYTMLQCRTARIGSYRVVPKERVILSSAGIRLTVPTIEDSTKNVVLTISILEIKKVLIHFGKGMPVLFVYVSPAAAAKIRSWLKMESKDGPYYDPSSSDETQKRITLLPEKLNEDCKISLKSIFLDGMMDELSIKEANELLVKASPKEINTMMKKAQGMSPHRMKDEIQTIMVYPPPPTKGGIAINTEDYACLGEDQFLNDVIIDFYLKYLTLSVLSEEDQARTHVFSTFFYKRLTTRPGKRRSNPVEDDPKLSPAEKRHRRVKGWTKHVNIFEKDFIIIPINEHCHWFLAIICFPGLTGPLKMLDNTPVILPKPKPRKAKKGVEQYLKVIGSTDSATLNVIAIAGIEDCLKGASLQIGSTTITPIKPTATITLDPCGEEGSDRDEAEGDDEEMEQGTSDDEDESSSSQSQTETNNEKHLLFSDVLPEEPRPPTPKPPKPEVLQQHRRGGKVCREPIKQPCILIFDSLAGASRSRVVATLRDYLRIEYKVKEGKERDFSKDTIKGGTPKVPQQTNFTDCGVYVLQYAESFFKDPIKDYYLPMRNLANWFAEDVVNRKREEIKNLLVELMEKQDIDVESLNLPKLVFPSSEEHQQESVMPERDATVENSGALFNCNTETVEGGLLIGCTEEDDYEDMETDDDVEDPAKIPDTAEFKKKEISKIVVESKFKLKQNDLNSKVDSLISIGECKRSLVNYPDTDSDESGITNAVQGNSTMSTPASSSSSEITPGKTNNTMKYLKSKRIERHLTRKSDATSVKRLKTGNDAVSNNDR